MLNRNLIVLFSLLFCGALQAQDLDLIWGSPLDTKNDVIKIVGETDEGIYTVTSKGKNYFLDFCSGEKMIPKFSQELRPPKVKGEETIFGNLFLLEGNLLMFSYRYDRNNKTYNIYGNLLDERGKIKGETKEVIIAEVESKGRRGGLGFRVSRDKSKVIAYHSANFKKSGDYFGVTVRLLTSELDLIKEFEEKIPTKSGKDRFTISDYAVSNEGAVYMAYQQYGKVDKEWVNKAMNIVQWAPRNGFEKRLTPVDLGNKQATRITLDLDQEDNLIGGGFYNARTKGFLGSYAGIAGTYFIRMNFMTGELMAASTSDFGKDFAQTLLTDKQVEKGRLVPDNFYMRRLIPKADGGIVMLAEYYTQISSSNNRVITHVHGPVMVVDVAPNGEIRWVNSVIKSQYYQQPSIGLGGLLGPFTVSVSFFLPTKNSPMAYHSFVVGVEGADIYLIYNDNAKNIEVREWRKTKVLNGVNKATPVIVKVDSEGNIDKNVFERDKKQVLLRPGVSLQNDYDKIIIYGKRGSEEKLGKLMF